MTLICIAKPGCPTHFFGNREHNQEFDIPNNTTSMELKPKKYDKTLMKQYVFKGKSFSEMRKIEILNHKKLDVADTYELVVNALIKYFRKLKK
jgi:hypothetical protein